MLLVFTAMIAFANWMLSVDVGSWTGLNECIASNTGGGYDQFSLQYI